MFQSGLRGRRPGAVPAVLLPVLRGQRGRELRRSLPRLPESPAGGAVRPAPQGDAHPTQAGRQLRQQGPRHHLRQEQQQARPQEEAFAQHLKLEGSESGT